MEFGIEPLTARSLVLSALLGTHPPRLPVRALVSLGALFGFAEGTVRTALSRMAASDEITADHRGYSLGPRLRRRQESQDAGRRSPVGEWDGSWWVAHVVGGGRTITERRAFRSRMREHRMGEWQPELWLRPANIAGPDPTSDLMLTHGRIEERDPLEVVNRLWDVDQLRRTGEELIGAADRALASLAAADPAALPDTFMVSVAVIRFLLTEPQLPAELVGPAWPADALRPAYDELESAHGKVMSAFLARASARPG